MGELKRYKIVEIAVTATRRLYDVYLATSAGWSYLTSYSSLRDARAYVGRQGGELVMVSMIP